MISTHLSWTSLSRGVARGGGGRAPPGFGRSVNPTQTMGGRLCPSHYCQPPGFKMLSTPLSSVQDQII